MMDRPQGEQNPASRERISPRSTFDRTSLRQIKSRAAPFTRGRISDSIVQRACRGDIAEISRRYRGDVIEKRYKHTESERRYRFESLSSSDISLSPVNRVRARGIDGCFNVALEDRGMLRRGWDESRDHARAFDVERAVNVGQRVLQACSYEDERERERERGTGAGGGRRRKKK